MKKLIVLILILVSIASVAVADLYPAVGEVCAINYTLDYVVFEANDNFWVMFGAEEWDVGDVAALLMDDHDTYNIFDDSIEKALYTE